MSISGIHHVTFIVNDLERARWFYGHVLGLEQKSRPAFKMPGLFYQCGSQEIHLILSSRDLSKEDLFLDIGGGLEITRRYIHRHAALLVSDLAALRARLRENDVEILFSTESARTDENDLIAGNQIEGWTKMYGAVPIFCTDPSGNLLELVPWKTEV